MAPVDLLHRFVIVYHQFRLNGDLAHETASGIAGAEFCGPFFDMRSTRAPGDGTPDPGLPPWGLGLRAAGRALPVFCRLLSAVGRCLGRGRRLGIEVTEDEHAVRIGRIEVVRRLSEGKPEVPGAVEFLRLSLRLRSSSLSSSMVSLLSREDCTATSMLAAVPGLRSDRLWGWTAAPNASSPSELSLANLASVSSGGAEGWVSFMHLR